MIERLIDFLGPWNWWVLGILLASVEIFAPGSFFIWFAVAALITGTIALSVDIGWQLQVGLFAGIALVAALAGRKVYGARGRTAGQPLNDRAARQVGRLATLDTPIANGTGHARLDDTLWLVQGPDLPAGARVRIIAVRDGRLQVEASPG